VWTERSFVFLVGIQLQSWPRRKAGRIEPAGHSQVSLLEGKCSNGIQEGKCKDVRGAPSKTVTLEVSSDKDCVAHSRCREHCDT
jgi:hypothetical protein